MSEMLTAEPMAPGPADGASATAATMRAAIVTGPGSVRLARVPMPQPGARQVRIRLEGCGA